MRGRWGSGKKTNCAWWLGVVWRTERSILAPVGSWVRKPESRWDSESRALLEEFLMGVPLLDWLTHSSASRKKSEFKRGKSRQRDRLDSPVRKREAQAFWGCLSQEGHLLSEQLLNPCCVNPCCALRTRPSPGNAQVGKTQTGLDGQGPGRKRTRPWDFNS